MTTYAVGRVHQIMDAVTHLTTASLCHHAEACEQVERWLCDAPSRLAYNRELVFMHLNTLRGLAFALTHAANMNMEQWEAAVQLQQRLRAEGQVPELHTGLPANHAQLERLYATTFVFQQYEYAPEVTIREGDVMLDCGACFGESSIWAAGKGAAQTYAFEPNPATFAQLTRNAADFGQGSITPVPLALGREAGVVPFIPEPDHPGASRLAAGEGAGTVPVQRVTLDRWCAENNVTPSFIKMDLEGAELNAIAGAAETIRTHRPRFAICLYHSIQDMWTIPHALHALCPEYRFWCRKNAPDSEFVLYGSAE